MAPRVFFAAREDWIAVFREVSGDAKAQIRIDRWFDNGGFLRNRRLLHLLRACGDSCGCRSSCSCGQSSSCQSCSCNQGCSCNEPCRCCRPCLVQILFPGLRCERSKGAGEQYGECSTCGCGECYQGDWISQPPLRTVRPLWQLGRPRRTDAIVSTDAATLRLRLLWPAIKRPAVEWSDLQRPDGRRGADARSADGAANEPLRPLPRLRCARRSVAAPTGATTNSDRRILSTPTLGAIGRPRLAKASWGRGARRR